MKKEKLNKFIGKKVEVKIFDGDIAKGKLINDLSGMTSSFEFKGWYHCVDDYGKTSFHFRSSHVVSLKEIE